MIACGNLYCKIALCSGTKIDSFKAVGSTRKLFQKHFYVKKKNLITVKKTTRYLIIIRELLA